MRVRLARRALEQVLWGEGQPEGTVDFSRMTDDEVEELGYAAGGLSRQAEAERRKRLHQKAKDAMAALKK